MKVNIGPYRYDLIPIRNWERKYELFRSDGFCHEEEDWKWFDKIVYKIFDGLITIFLPLNRWSSNRPRKVKVYIDNYDVWSADHSLALVIHPTLAKLKETQHGYPIVDPKDVPKHLRTTEDPELNTADTSEERWNWVLGEMIWAFEQCSKENKGEDQFHHNSDQLEMVRVPCEDKSGYNSVTFNHQKDPTKPKYWVDTEGKKLHNDRISNGLKLFAKYYFSLWD